jgi:hypothetical protein
MWTPAALRVALPTQRSPHSIVNAMRIGLTFLLLSTAAASGCASLQPDNAGAAEVAQEFHTAFQDADGAEMCDAIATSTVEQIEISTGRNCEDGIANAHIPAAHGVVAADVYGRAAQVRMHGDTVFLTRTSHGWKVIAAGCHSRGDEQPYECIVEGK